MKKFDLKFWSTFDLKFWSTLAYYQANSQFPSYTETFVTVRVTPSTWPKEGCPNGYMFTYRNSYHMFVDSFEIIPSKSSRNWEDFFSVNLHGANHLIISSISGMELFLNFPELILDVPEPFNE